MESIDSAASLRKLLAKQQISHRLPEKEVLSTAHGGRFDQILRDGRDSAKMLFTSHLKTITQGKKH